MAIRFLGTTSELLEEIDISDGQVFLITDTEQIAYDIEGERKVITPEATWVEYK